MEKILAKMEKGRMEKILAKMEKIIVSIPFYLCIPNQAFVYVFNFQVANLWLY